MKFLYPILILATAYIIRSGLENMDDKKCGLDGRKFKMTLDNGPADVFFLSGKDGTCIAGVKDDLPFEKAKGSCEKMFSGGTMMSEKNFNQLQLEIKESTFKNMRNSYMLNGSDCIYVDNNQGQGKLTMESCKTPTEPQNYLCQYPMQYNCAWQHEYVEISQPDATKGILPNQTVFSYPNEIGTQIDCPLTFKGSLRCKLSDMFPDKPTPWSSCSESCTDPTKPPPTQTMKRRVDGGCFEETTGSKVVYLHTVRTCNGHVLCPPTKASAAANSSWQWSIAPTTSWSSPLSNETIYGICIACGVLLVVIVAIGVTCWCKRRNRDDSPVSGRERSTTRRSKRRPSLNAGKRTSRKSPSLAGSKKRRSVSPSPSRDGQKSDAESAREDNADQPPIPIRPKGRQASPSPRRSSPSPRRSSPSPRRSSPSPARGREGDAASGRKRDTGATASASKSKGVPRAAPTFREEIIDDPISRTGGATKFKRLLSMPAIVPSTVHKASKSKK